MEKTPKPNKPKQELTESRRQALEDLKETLVGFMGVDLPPNITEKVKNLLDDVENEMAGNGGTEEESGWKIE